MRDIDSKLVDELLGRWGELSLATRFYILGYLCGTDREMLHQLAELIAEGLNRA